MSESKLQARYTLELKLETEAVRQVKGGQVAAGWRPGGGNRGQDTGRTEADTEKLALLDQKGPAQGCWRHAKLRLAFFDLSRTYSACWRFETRSRPAVGYLVA